MTAIASENLFPSANKLIIFTQPLRSGKIWHKVNFLSRV